MKAAVIHELGNEDVFRYEDVPNPEPRPRQVLLRIESASVNRGDLFRREGGYGGSTAGAPLPLILGWDVAGTIVEAGSEVRTREVGQKVVATLPQGGYAEMVAAHEAGTVPMPDNISFDEGASIPIVFLTSWFALLKVANLREGETALIQSAGSGVGMAGIQIAKHMGCTVITTAGSQEKLDRARELGADHCINYNQADFLAETMSITDRAGVDVVLEAVGGEVLTKSVEALSMGGRVVTVGNTSRGQSTVDPGLMLNRLLTLHGFSLATQMGRGGVMQELHTIMDSLRPRQAPHRNRPRLPPQPSRRCPPPPSRPPELRQGVVAAVTAGIYAGCLFSVRSSDEPRRFFVQGFTYLHAWITDLPI